MSRARDCSGPLENGRFCGPRPNRPPFSRSDSGPPPAILDTIQSETGKARRDALAEIVTVAGTARYYLANGEDHLEIQTA